MASVEALYGIEFVSLSDSGYGVVILETNRIFGGDSSFVYIGDYEVKNGKVYADVKCTNDRKTLPSIFGDINEFNLHLEGDLGDKEIILYGQMIENPEQKIGVKLTRRSELP